MTEKRDVSKRTTSFILIGIIVLAAVLRLYGLDKQSLWYDEIVVEEAFKHLNKAADSPLLYLFFIYPMTKIFPGSDYALRIPSAIFGVISVPMMFLLVRKLFNEKTGLIASFLLAISPFHIWHSQDARMYALHWLLTLISLIYFVNALEKPSRKNFVGYVTSTVACLYTHPFAVFLVITQGLYILLFFRKYKTHYLKWFAAFSTVTALFLPWIVFTLMHWTSTVGGYFPRGNSPYAVFYTLYSYSTGYSIGPTLIDLHNNQSLAVITPYLNIILPLIVLYGTLFSLGIWAMRKERNKLIFLLLLLVVPIISVFILSTVIKIFWYNVRYTAIASFAFLIFIAKGIEWLSYLSPKKLGRITAVLAIAAITGFSSYSYFNYQFDKRYQKDDFRSAVAYVKKNMMPNDAFLCFVNADVFNRYSTYDPQCVIPPIYKSDKQMINTAMYGMVPGKDRMWLVLNREWAWPPIDNLGNHVKEWLDTNYVEIKELHKGITEIANIRIYCYDLTKKREKN
jgi:mannosyltransferase